MGFTMTVSRSFAPPPAEYEGPASVPPPVFPLFPYAYMAYAEHCSRDYAHYVDKLVRAEESLSAEETLGLGLLAEMNQAFFSLVWAPIGAAISDGSR